MIIIIIIIIIIISGVTAHRKAARSVSQPFLSSYIGIPATNL